MPRNVRPAPRSSNSRVISSRMARTRLGSSSRVARRLAARVLPVWCVFDSSWPPDTSSRVSFARGEPASWSFTVVVGACSAATGGEAPAERAPPRASLPGPINTLCSCRSLRCVAGSKARSVSTSSPKRSMRTGWDRFGGQMSTMPPRRAKVPGSSTTCTGS